MAEKKSIRTKGKISFSRYFQKLNEGDSVAVIREISLRPRFPKRLQGKTGKVIGQRGSSYEVLIKDQNKEKKFILNPIHLKKILN
ncbi:MAG: 50S ribosomal protein L21e [Nanoarchaeota archaeon]|nr:50S ribosomal protein L21e [Nanoarchaeota archaeon]